MPSCPSKWMPSHKWRTCRSCEYDRLKGSFDWMWNRTPGKTHYRPLGKHQTVITSALIKAIPFHWKIASISLQGVVWVFFLIIFKCNLMDNIVDTFLAYFSWNHWTIWCFLSPADAWTPPACCVTASSSGFLSGWLSRPSCPASMPAVPIRRCWRAEACLLWARRSLYVVSDTFMCYLKLPYLFMN